MGAGRVRAGIDQKAMPLRLPEMAARMPVAVPYSPPKQDCRQTKKGGSRPFGEPPLLGMRKSLQRQRINACNRTKS